MKGEDKRFREKTEGSWQESNNIKSDISNNRHENIRRRLLNLPVQPSSDADKPNDGNRQEDATQEQTERELERQRGQRSNNRSQQPYQGKGSKKKKESAASRRAKATAKNAAKKQSKQTAKKVARKVVSKASKKAVSAAVKALAKGLAMIVSALGIPAIIIILLVSLLIILIMMISSFSLGTGSAVEELGDDAVQLRDYIREASESSVDMEKTEQIPFIIPQELLSAVVQIDSNEKEYDEEGLSNPVGDYKRIIDLFVEKLSAEFTYETYEEYTETRTRKCEEEADSCGDWKYKKETRKVDRLIKIEAWNGVAEATHKEIKDGWSSGMESQSREVYYVEDDFEFTFGFDKLDRILEEQGYELRDKETFEMIYEQTTDREMQYIRWLNGEEITVGFDDFYFIGDIIPGQGVPPQFMPYYLDASKKYSVAWEYIAAIHRVETVFSTIPHMVSSAGAVGHTQFMKCTWIGWSYKGCKGTKGNAVVPEKDLTNPAMIKKYGGYGRDGNGDGKADPFNIEDALHSTAYYLQKNGINSNPQKAIRAYNHSTKYVNDVMGYAKKFREEAIYLEGGGGPEGGKNPSGFIRPSKGKITSGYGGRFNSFHHGLDIGRPHPGNVPIWAAADGIVSRSYLSSSYGNAVFIKHMIKGRKYETVYAHLQRRFVKEGQKVTQGHVIGYMGNTGSVIAGPGGDGTHLHFEVHGGNGWNAAKSNSMNPATVLPK